MASSSKMSLSCRLPEPRRTHSVDVNESQGAAAESVLQKAVGLAGAEGRWLLLFPGRLQVGMADSSCRQTQCGSATCRAQPVLHSLLLPPLGRGECAREYSYPQCPRSSLQRGHLNPLLRMGRDQQYQGGSQRWLSEVKVDSTGSSETL